MTEDDVDIVGEINEEPDTDCFYYCFWCDKEIGWIRGIQHSGENQKENWRHLETRMIGCDTKATPSTEVTRPRP